MKFANPMAMRRMCMAALATVNLLFLFSDTMYIALGIKKIIKRPLTDPVYLKWENEIDMITE